MLHEGWALVCQAGLWGWIVSAVGFIMKAFPSRGVFEKRAAITWGICLAVGYAVWIVGMVMA